MDPLTPNTAAFLSCLSSATEEGLKTPSNPTSLPPSAFFTMPVPGRDTPEKTPESSGNDASVSPEAQPGRAVSDTDDGSPAERRLSGGGGGSHKRKAGHSHTVQQLTDDEDDSEEDLPSGHEDKRLTANHKSNDAAVGSGRRGGRKSIGNEEAPSKGTKEVTKAARRKEQNRAAQKAFRERREAKVRDLEDKVAELESKSYGVTVENENLRGILKRLQEENVALKQSAFTFSMPASGGAAKPSFPSQPQPQVGKPPSPPHSVDDNSLRSINDPAPNIPHRASSGALAATPESLVSLNSASTSGSGSERPKNHPLAFDPAESFNAFAVGVRPEWGRFVDAKNANANAVPVGNAYGGSKAGSPEKVVNISRSTTGLSPPTSSVSNNRSEIDALWASFYPNGVDALVAGQNQNQVQNQAQSSSAPQTALQSQQQPDHRPSALVGGERKDTSMLGPMHPFNLFGAIDGTQPTSTGLTPFINGNGNVNPIDKMAFRDRGNVDIAGTSAPQQLPADHAFDWASFGDSGVDEFLASLTGGDTGDNNANAAELGADVEFSAQLQALLAQNGSPSAQLGPSPATGFSPTNYLNMSPSPLVSVSNSQSPASNNLFTSNSNSNAGSPESSGSSQPSTTTGLLGTGYGTFGPGKTANEIVHVVGEDGKIVKPSELWVRMGMQHEANVDHLLIDDLCDQMRAKATCKDGTHYLKVADAETMFKYRGGDPAHERKLAAMTGNMGRG